jgi:hypothetical protein
MLNASVSIKSVFKLLIFKNNGNPLHAAAWKSDKICSLIAGLLKTTEGLSQVQPLKAVACFMSRHVGTENKKARQCFYEPMCSPEKVGTGISGF